MPTEAERKVLQAETKAAKEAERQAKMEKAKETSIYIKGYTIINDVGVYQKRQTSSTLLKTLPLKTEIIFRKQVGNWLYAEEYGGWILAKYIYSDQITDEDGEIKISSMSPEEQEAEMKKQNKKKAQDEENLKELAKQLNKLDKFMSDPTNTTLTTDGIADGLLLNNLNGVYGIPYQFMESVDPRLNSNGSSIGIMGRKYSEKIISKMPLLCVTPGKVQFMTDFRKEEKSGIIAALFDKDGPETELSNIVSHNGRYFTFAFDYAGYFQYVNGLCRSGARFLNIENVKLDIGGHTDAAKNFDWSLALNSSLKASFTSQEFIGFYIDSADSISESFTNETTQSQLSSTVNGMSDLAREVGFLMGAGAGKTVQFMDQESLGETQQKIEDFTKKYFGGNKFLRTLMDDFSTVAVGGKLLFPEIWSDSNFSRSFDINIKLRTPDSDVISWYLNIYVPLCHLISLTAAHQTSNANGYYSPFLVRAFYRGMFNIDMGIVTDMSITKGKEAAWSIDGLPTEVDVSLTIKDLYNMLSIIPGNEPKNFVTNNILMDYVANMCGININEMDIKRSLEIYYILTTDKLLDLPNRTLRRFQDAIDTYSMNMYNSLLKLLI